MATSGSWGLRGRAMALGWITRRWWRRAGHVRTKRVPGTAEQRGPGAGVGRAAGHGVVVGVGVVVGRGAVAGRGLGVGVGPGAGHGAGAGVGQAVTALTHLLYLRPIG